jgi:NAD(P)-dependent dehydrogenase (short-subunit alcohol dehydrogenase family)
MNIEEIEQFSNKHNIPVILLSDIYKYYLESKRVFIKPSIPFVKNFYLKLANKTIVVAGTTSGMGKAIKELLSQNDCCIIDLSISTGCDIANEEQVLNKLKDVGHIDFVINCAGFIKPESVEHTTIENWKRHYDTNVTGALVIMKHSIPLMKEGGSIIHISSPCANKVRKTWAAYCSSKAALNSLIKVSAEELKPKNISVYGVSPSKTNTKMIYKLFKDLDVKKILDPKDVAMLVINIMIQNFESGIIFSIKNDL